MEETDVLIVGAGFAGLETAMPLRRKAKAASITLLTKEPYGLVGPPTKRTTLSPGCE
jgi:NADH dehydrogenase FAD-containing subunit